ncbi:MAG: hypothetical protein K0U72_02930 [Gammaproteobacteria bacterium]|nr:hypothetical protein [Gammaproteobacteria bacterium]
MKIKLSRSLSLFGLVMMFGCVSTPVPLKEAAPESFVGVFSTHDPDILDVAEYLTGWNTSTVGARKQVFLRVTDPGFKYGETAEWALIIRGDEALMTPGSIAQIADGAVSVRMYRLHSVDTSKCCVNTLPYEEFDIADSSYIGTKGRIDFLGRNRARFVVWFQQETTTNSGELIGKSFQVTGCWNIEGEYRRSGCRLDED